MHKTIDTHGNRYNDKGECINNPFLSKTWTWSKTREQKGY